MSKLDEILSYKRQELAQAKERRPLPQIERALKQRPPIRDFRGAVTRQGRLSLIAEIKKASPSAGPIHPEADVLAIAKVYERSGAQAISVLTDARFFSGSLKDLVRVRENVSLPVLRKDFLLEEYPVVEAAAAGADAVLLIAAALPNPVLKRLIALTQDLSLAALVEVHNERELGDALESGAEIIGVNNRNLATFQVDLKTTERLFLQIPPGKTRVSESGIRSRADVEFVQSKGADAVLIGEEFMSAPDPGVRIREMVGS